MALAVTSPYSQVQENYLSSCASSFKRYIENSSDYSEQTFRKNSVLLDFSEIVSSRECSLYSAEVPGVSLTAVQCGEHFYKPVNLKPSLRSVPFMNFEFADIKHECELSCIGIGSERGMMAFFDQLFMKLRKSIITTIDSLLLSSISSAVYAQDCGTQSTITMEADGVPTINATAAGGLTDAVLSQVLIALSENNALSNNADDVLLILPQRAIAQWRASIPANSLDFSDYSNGSTVSRIRGMNVYTPMDEVKVFKKATTTGTSPITGIAAYAITRNALRFGHKPHDRMLDDPSGNRVNINLPYGVASLGANVFDVRRGIHFAYDLQAAGMRQAPWGIVRILLPANIFTA